MMELNMRALARWLTVPGSRLVFALGQVLLGAGTLGGCALGLSDPTPPPGRASIEELEAYVREAIADADPPSISITVSQGGRAVYERAFGYADGPGAVQATPETTYRWFSVTKPLTAAAILRLAEEGAISLSEPAATYLPYMNELYGGDASQITIERLLSHRAGIGDVGNAILSWVHVKGHHRQSELLRQRLPPHVHFDPAQLDRGHYSNLGYMMLGAVIESASSESYEAYVTNRFLVPLRMQRTRFYYEEAFAPGTVHAAGSHPDDFMAFLASFSLDLDTLSRGCSRQRWWFEYFSPDQAAPSGLVSTSSDMVRFGQMIHNRGILDGTRVLSEASVERMTRARVGVSSSPAGHLPESSFGDSWFIMDDAMGRRVLMHGGQAMAFTSLLLIRPEDELVAALVANGTYVDGSDGLELMGVLANMDWARADERR
jgi:CubicO group peptidase (beta-lactamase class C family)